MNLSQQLTAHSAGNLKVNRLHQLLLKEKDLFENVAEHVSDHSLRYTILSLAQQNKQYAAELSCYMQSTGTSGNLKERNYQRFTSSTPLPDDSTALAFCSSNERKIISAYRNLLSETALFEGLTNIIGYQLSGSLSAMLQLKLLSAVKRRYKNVRAAIKHS